MTINEKINAGMYENNLCYPSVGATIDERRAYNKEYSRLHGVFREDAIEEVGLTGHPKALEAFELAWVERHRSGRSDVVDFLDSLATLLLG
jgi:hypothetical protein